MDSTFANTLATYPCKYAGITPYCISTYVLPDSAPASAQNSLITRWSELPGLAPYNTNAFFISHHVLLSI